MIGKISSRDIKGFFHSQYFTDGLRITFGVLLPSLVFVQFGKFDVGISLSLGALCVSVVDIPGPLTHKRNAMALCNLSIFIVAIITGFARLNMYSMGITVVVFSFFFSMLTVYGNRAASLGTASLLVMILMMDKAVKPEDILSSSAIILAGGIWYMLFALIFFGVRPYRAAQQTLGESIADVAKFLRIKAAFYEPDTDIDDNYRKLVSQQIQVSLHQDAVREILFKSRLLVRESTSASRILVLTFVDLVDMFENIMATHYDYSALREQFKGTGILEDIAQIIQHMAYELDNAAYIVLSNSRYKQPVDFIPELDELKQKIDMLRTPHETSTLVLKKILINLRDMNSKIASIYNYYHSDSAKLLFENRRKIEYSKFVTHQDYAAHIFWDNFTMSSATFKHALRVSLVCLVGFAASKILPLGHHSYWVLLTIIVILKPGFSLSKQRNYQRLIGTICGGVIGIAILIFVKDKDTLFILLVFFMLGCYSFQRLNYVVSVLLMTPYILILFSFLGVNHIIEERITDTIIGSTIAFIASYVLFPSWEYELIQDNLRNVIYANATYLAKIAETIAGNVVDITEYKLARKEVFVQSGNLSAAFERMTSEPKSKQKKVKEVHKFVVLNHILSSYIATVAAEIIGRRNTSNAQPEAIKLLRKSMAILNDTSLQLGGKKVDYTCEKPTVIDINRERLQPVIGDHLLRDQLGFINKMSVDIAKVAVAIVSSP